MVSDPTDADGAARRPLISRLSAAAAVAIGLTVLVGWAADLEVLKCVFPGLIAMKPNAALGFVTAGLALLAIRPGRRNPGARALAAATLAIGGLTLLEYAAGVDLQVDQVLFRESDRARFSLAPGRMHPTTAFDFVLLATATLLIASDRGYRAAHGLALAAALVAGSALVGYAYGVRLFVGLAVFNQMALHTTLGMLALATSAITSRPGRGLMTVVGGDSAGGQMARRLLPVAILLPFTLDGLALLSNHYRLFDERFATAMRVVITIAIFAGCIGWNARALHRAERDRRRTEDRYRFMADAMPLLVWTATPEGVSDYFNRRWCDFTGLGVEENHGRGWEAILHPEDRRRCLDRWALAVRTGERYEIEYRFRRADGAYRWHLGRAEPMRDAAGRVSRWFGTCTDIHDQKIAGEQRYRSLVEATTAIVWTTPSSGEFESEQPGWSAFTGQDFDQLRGWGWLDAVHPDDRAETARVWGAAVAGRSLYQVGHRLRRADGSYRHMLVRAVPILDADGLIREWVGVHTDVDEQARAHQAMRQAKEAAEAATRAKGEFLANMSHEIRTPMNGILGMTELALGTDLSPRQREYLGLVKSSADALLTVIDDILDFSKIEAGKLTLDPLPFDPREAVTDTLRALAFRAHDKGLELACRIGPEVPATLVGDAGRLRQILVNLVGNAIKFTERGEICVEVEAGPGDPGGPREIRVAVADTGIGIPANKRAAIFAPFEQADGSTTRKFGGTGLGLSISSRLVELMGGRIGVEDNPDGGSVFRFEVRLAEGSGPGTAPGRAPADPALLAGLRVLVVDDNRTNRRILEELLAVWNCRVSSAPGGHEALRALEQSEARGEPFDVVLLDRMMPGMDGCTLAARISANPARRGLKLLMLTSGGEDDSARFRDLGIGAWLAKPIRQSELLDALLGQVEPALRAPDAGRPAPGPLGDCGGPRLRVLLAEDHPINQKVATRMLEEMGHSVRVVGDGRAAVSAAGSELFDLVLMDVQMPEMDGFEALAAIRAGERATGRHLPIVALTAHAMAGDRERCLASGFDDYLSKPIHSAGLRAVLGRIAAGSTAGTSPTEPGPDGPPAFDRAAALDNLGGDEALLGEVLGIFLGDAPRLLREVREAVEAGDAPTLKRLGHTLAGVSCNFAAADLVASARRIEAMGKAGDLAGAPEAEARLGRDFEAFRSAVTASGLVAAGGLVGTP